MDKKNERLLITGGSGLLGSSLITATEKDFEVHATYFSSSTYSSDNRFVPLDIRDKKQVLLRFKDINPTLVIHTAALVNVDYCQEHPDEAWASNIVGTENVALASREIGAKLIYISTDSVFDGKKGIYAEEDITGPVNTYASTKLEGESKVQNLLPDSIILRTAFYGWSQGNSQKVNLATWVVNELRQFRTIKMFTDVFFSPILISNLCEVLIEMHRKNLRGIYHVAGNERCSKYRFGLEIARSFGLDKSLIHPSTIYEVFLNAPRPKDTSLGVTKISKLMNTRLYSVREGIARFRDSEYRREGQVI